MSKPPQRNPNDPLPSNVIDLGAVAARAKAQQNTPPASQQYVGTPWYLEPWFINRANEDFQSRYTAAMTAAAELHRDAPPEFIAAISGSIISQLAARYMLIGSLLDAQGVRLAAGMPQQIHKDFKLSVTDIMLFVERQSMTNTALYPELTQESPRVPQPAVADDPHLPSPGVRSPSASEDASMPSPLGIPTPLIAEEDLAALPTGTGDRQAAE